MTRLPRWVSVLALLGGIGGSLTVICYGYWMRAAAWSGAEKLATMRTDLRLAYGFTGLFGIALVAFSITGAFVMPFLAATLLYLNNRRDWMGPLANRWRGNTALVVCLIVFGAVCVVEIWTAFGA